GILAGVCIPRSGGACGRDRATHASAAGGNLIQGHMHPIIEAIASSVVVGDVDHTRGDVGGDRREKLMSLTNVYRSRRRPSLAVSGRAHDHVRVEASLESGLLLLQGKKG